MDRLLVAHEGVRVPRTFEVSEAGRRRISRRTRRSPDRGQEGGLEVTVREKETRREVGHEWRDQW